jgi:CRP/FNR family cyclic AMP-dependent transcriptional regulator
MTQEILDRRVFPAGAKIFSEGQPGDRAFLVQSGAVEIFKEAHDGVELLGRIAPGGIFGEMALIDNRPRMATARAAEETVCVVIPQAVFEKKIAVADPFIVALLRIFMANVRTLASR